MQNNFPEILTQKANEKKMKFREALFDLDKNSIMIDNLVYLTAIYNESKKLDIRNKILMLLYDFDFVELKAFFSNAYKKERYLDMKIYALRGLSNFVEEKEIAKLLEKFNAILAQRAVSTPYNYQEYELLRGKNALPFLVEKFGYNCFKETLEQVNRQYDSMPDVFKGHFTINENGDYILLRESQETIAMIEKFWEVKNK